MGHCHSAVWVFMMYTTLRLSIRQEFASPGKARGEPGLLVWSVLASSSEGSSTWLS